MLVERGWLRQIVKCGSVKRSLVPWASVGVLLLGGCSEISRVVSPSASLDSEVIAPRSSSDRPLTPTAEDTNFVVSVVEKVEPSVVQIITSQTVRNRIPEALNDPFFREFFGDRLPAQPRERTVSGIGSGFVINANGQILTNAHVVANADTVQVSFPGGRNYEGKVVGADPVTDIAVVQIPANNLPTVELGSSDQVRPGQWAIAIGNPLGLQETVTLGVISATDRSSRDVGVSDKRIGFLQTDAAINPGNSGGPLLNARGQVIGVNTAIIGGAQGLGFAIPIDAARRIAEQLITTGKVEHPYIGVQLVPLTPEIRQELANDPELNLQVADTDGILIVRVTPDSPAAQAGLRAGDVIQQINGEEVSTADAVQRLVEQNGLQKPLALTIQRGDRTLQVSVRPEPLPAPIESRGR